MSREDIKRPAYILGERFIDAQGREFEIAETYWESVRDRKSPIRAIINIEGGGGYRIHYGDEPKYTEMKRLGIRQLDPPEDGLIIRDVEQLQRAERMNAIKFINNNIR